MTHIENAPARKAIPTCSSWCVVLSMSSVVQSCCSSSSCRSKISITLRPPSSSNSLVHAVLDNKLLSMISSKVPPRSALSGTPSGRIFCSVSSVWEVLAIQSSTALSARSQSSIAWKGHKSHTGKGLFRTFNIVTCDIDDMSDMSVRHVWHVVNGTEPSEIIRNHQNHQNWMEHDGTKCTPSWLSMM